EITSLVFAVAVAACIPAGLAGGVNLKIDILARWLTGRVGAWLDALGALLLFVVFLLLTWRIAVYAASLVAQGRATLILGWPIAPTMYAVAFLFGIGTLVQPVLTVNATRRALTDWAAPQAEQASPVVTIIVLLVAGVVFALVAFVLFEFAWATRWASQNIGLVVTIAFIVMWLLMLAQVPLAAVMGLTGIVGSALFTGFAPAVSAFATEATTFLMNSQVATLPLFLMMGSFAAVSGMSDDMYRLRPAFLQRFLGGVAARHPTRLPRVRVRVRLPLT